MSKTFCPIPWNFQAIRANGDLRVCCQANVTPNQGVIRKPDGTAYNAGTDILSDARNDSMLKTMRINMLNGVWSEECGRCKSEEESGLISRRTYENQQWPMDIDAVRAKTSEDGSITGDNFPVVYYDLRFGNFCNLKCRMCGPSDSDSWYTDWMKLTDNNKFKDAGRTMTIVDGKVSDYDWHRNEEFWTQLEANIPNIQHVYIAGGEPLLIDRHYEFLQKCVDQDCAKNIVIEYNTNVTTLPLRAIRLWEKFKQIRIGASVDGMESVLEYQRHPAKWDKVLRNLEKIEQLPDNVVGWLAYTVTAYNVNHMIDFMKWKLSASGFKKLNGTRRKPIVTHHVAHHPRHLNIRVLPDEYKQRVTNKFDDFVQWTILQGYPEHVINHAREIASGVTRYMNSESYYNSHWSEFLSYTRRLDQLRSENIVMVEPMLAPYFEEENNSIPETEDYNPNAVIGAAASFDTVDLLTGNVFQVTWDLGRRCNYDCSYCPEHRHDNSSPHASLENLKKNSDFVLKYINLYMKYRSYKHASINFTGGEPTVNPNFIEFLQYLKQQYQEKYADSWKCVFTVTSNGAMSKKIADAIIQECDHITISYHTEASAQIKEQVKERIVQFDTHGPANGCSLSINVMFHAQYFDECLKVCEFLDSKKIKYVPRIIGEEPGSKPSFAHKYSAEQTAWFKNYWDQNTQQLQKNAK